MSVRFCYYREKEAQKPGFFGFLKTSMAKNAYLILANGTVFAGKSFGADGEVIGELVFSTGMTGYVETLTDPSYFGQIVVQTFPSIGNYGVMSADCENKCSHLKAYVVREWCQDPSNFRCEGDLDTFLKEKNVVGLYGIDTRALTKIIRDEGIMNAKIAYSAEACEKVLEEIRAYRITGAVEAVSVKEKTEYKAEFTRKSVAFLDLGTTYSVVNAFVSRDCDVTVYPASTSAEEILNTNPDGIVISEGPGQACENTAIITEVKKLMDSGVPMLGIGLGMQLIALASGADVEKLTYGHHGANQPVRYPAEDRVIVSAQNHNYVVKADTLPAGTAVTFTNANDGSCEGFCFTAKPISSVSFRPDMLTAPLNTGFVYDQFISSMAK